MDIRGDRRVELRRKREENERDISNLIIKRFYAITNLTEATEKLLGWRRQERETILIIR